MLLNIVVCEGITALAAETTAPVVCNSVSGVAGLLQRVRQICRSVVDATGSVQKMNQSLRPIVHMHSPYLWVFMDIV